MPKKSRKHPGDGQEASRSSIQTSTGTVIPGDLGKLSISEFKNLCRKLNFACKASREQRNRRRQK